MDEGPFRMPRSTDRRATNKPEPSQQPEVEHSRPVVREEPKPVHHKTPPSRYADKEENFFKRFLIPAIISAVVVVIIIVAVVVWPKPQTTSTATAIDTSKYQAVFFTNGNVYFGKLQPFNDEYMKMTTVYYPKTQAKATDQTPTTKKTDTEDTQSNVTLIKLSDEIHGPEDEMFISKDQVQFFQNLRADSKVAKLIDGQKK
ncbi:MAG: hypothetical protein WAW80_04580 [Candidatus Saccharimonadales bacterium]